MKNPCISSHRRALSILAWPSVWTPSTTTFMPRACAIVMMALKNTCPSSVLSSWGGKCLIDLQSVEIETLQLRQRRIASPEVIDQHLDAHFLNRLEAVDDILAVTHDRRFGQFDLDQLRLDPMPGQRQCKDVSDIGLIELAR
jgi:hypothetical protein